MKKLKIINIELTLDQVSALNPLTMMMLKNIKKGVMGVPIENTLPGILAQVFPPYKTMECAYIPPGLCNKIIEIRRSWERNGAD